MARRSPAMVARQAQQRAAVRAQQSIKGKPSPRPLDTRSAREIRDDNLLDKQISLPLFALLALFVADALSGTSSFSLPHLSTHLPHSIQTLLPAWARHLPILAPFATELPNASHGSKLSGREAPWSPTGYAGPFRSDAVGFGHPLTALHNLTRACLGLSYEVRQPGTGAFGASFLPDDLRFGQGYFDRYPWNSWLSQNDATGPSFLQRRYEKGLLDAFFVLTGVLVFTVLRALVVRHVLQPLANFCVPQAKPKSTASRAAQAVEQRQRRRTCTRFAEQAWVALWGSFSLALSLYVAYCEPYWNRELSLWDKWPFTQLSGLSKFYYLLQTAFWVQQVIVLNVEDRRSDHWQMLSHHVVTILLLLGSYCSHFTPIGNVILILMDPCDILLAVAKCLRYSAQQTLCDVFFGLFMVGWIVSRHVFYNRALYSCIVVARERLPEIPGATRNDYWGFRSFTGLSLVVLLCVLQVILGIWLLMIVRVAYRVITGKGAADTRSDSESDLEEEEQEPTHPSTLSRQASVEPTSAMTTQAAQTTASALQTGKRRKGQR